MAGRRARVQGALAWSVALFLLWLLLVPASTAPEVAVGAVVAVAAALAVQVAGASSALVLQPDPGWFRRLARLPAGILRDSALLIAALPRRPRGSFSTVTFTAQQPPARADARRVLVIFTVTLTPNSLVAEVDDTTVLVHQLVPGRRLLLPGQ